MPGNNNDHRAQQMVLCALQPACPDMWNDADVSGTSAFDDLLFACDRFLLTCKARRSPGPAMRCAIFIPSLLLSLLSCYSFKLLRLQGVIVCGACRTC